VFSSFLDYRGPFSTGRILALKIGHDKHSQRLGALSAVGGTDYECFGVLHNSLLLQFQPVKDAIIEIVKWIRESVRPAIVLLVLAALILFFPHSWASSIGLSDGFSRYRFAAFLSFAGSLVWLLSFPIEKWYQLSKRKKRLAQLTENERDVLKHFIQNAKRTQCFGWSHVAVARSLAKSGILAETSSKDGHGNPYFEIESWAYSDLREHPELVSLPKK
jgi:Super-infection exclusion protein B